MLDGLPVTAASRQNAQEMLARIEQWKRQSGRIPATTR